MGERGGLGFGIIARKFIKKDESIYELIGLMPGDDKAARTDLSVIQPHPDQNQSKRAHRVLFGPVRFLNHLCHSSNAAVCP